MLGGVQGMTNQAGRIHGGQAVIAVSPKYAVKSIVHHQRPSRDGLEQNQKTEPKNWNRVRREERKCRDMTQQRGCRVEAVCIAPK